MKSAPLNDLKNCIANQFVVGLRIRHVPAMIFLCIEQADDQVLVVKDRDINGFEIPFRQQIKLKDILAVKITNIRFDDPDLVMLRRSYIERETFLNTPSTGCYLGGS
jgi:hypothetical protein